MASFSHVLDALQSNTTYELTVFKHTDLGDRASNTVTVTTEAVAATAPTLQIDSVAVGAIAVSWEPGDDGDFPTVSYRLEDTPQGGAARATVLDADARAATLAVVSDTTYDVRLVKIASDGSELASAVAQAITPPRAPDPPVLQLVGTGLTELQLGWAPGSHGDAESVTWQLRYRLASDAEFTAVAVGDEPERQYTLTGLVSDRQYYVQLAKVYESGEVLSGTVVATTDARPALAPVASIAAVSVDSIGVQWDPVDDGDALVTAYLVEYRLAGEAAFAVPALEAGGDVTGPVTLTSLPTSNAYYEVRVTKRVTLRGVDSELPSAVVPTRTAARLPNTPTFFVRATTPTSVQFIAGQVVLNDVAPEGVAYEVQHGSPTYAVVTTAITEIEALFTVGQSSPLASDHEYTFRLVVRYPAGDGYVAGEAVSAPLLHRTAQAPASPVEDIQQLSATVATMTLGWAPGVDGDAVVSALQLSYAPAGTDGVDALTLAADAAQATLVNLVSDTEYAVTIAKQTDLGAVATVAPAPFSTAPQPPTAVTLVGPVDATYDQAIVAWTRNSDGDADPASVGLRVELFANGAWSAVTTLASTVTTYTLQGLSGGVGYQVRVVKTSDLGEAPSAALAFTTPKRPADAPVIASVTDVTDGGAVVTWTLGAFHDAQVSAIRVQTSDAGLNIWFTRTTTTDTTAVQSTLNDLASNHLYDVRVVLDTDLGEVPSAPEPFTTAKALPVAPVLLTPTQLSWDGARLHWSVESKGDASTVTLSLEVTDAAAATEILPVAADATFYDVSALASLATYTARVVKATDLGTVISDSLTWTTEPRPADAPVATVGAVGVASATLTWTEGDNHDYGPPNGQVWRYELWSAAGGAAPTSVGAAVLDATLREHTVALATDADHTLRVVKVVQYASEPLVYVGSADLLVRTLAAPALTVVASGFYGLDASWQPAQAGDPTLGYRLYHRASGAAAFRAPVAFGADGVGVALDVAASSLERSDAALVAEGAGGALEASARAHALLPERHALPVWFEAALTGAAGLLLTQALQASAEDMAARADSLVFVGAAALYADADAVVAYDATGAETARVERATASSFWDALDESTARVGVAFDGVGTATGLRVAHYNAGAGAGAAAHAHAFVGLSAGAAYDVRLTKRYDAPGQDLDADASTSTYVAADPATLALGPAGASETTIDLTWTLGSPGSATLTALRLEFRVVGDAVWSVAAPAPGLADTAYLLGGLVGSSSYELRVVKETDLGVVVPATVLSALTADPPLPGEYVAPWVTLKVHYDFNSETLDEQTTGDPAYALAPSAGYAFTVVGGETWLAPVKRTEFLSHIHAILPKRNFTWQARVYDQMPHKSKTWYVEYGYTPNTADYAEIISLRPYNFSTTTNGSVETKIQPEPTLHGYTARTNAIITSLRTNNSFVPHVHVVDEYGRVLTQADKDLLFTGDQVWTVVFNSNQTTGTDLATPVGTVSTYLNNVLLRRRDVQSGWISLDQDFAFTDARWFRIRSDAENIYPFYFGHVKIFDGVVDMRMLNELPPLL
jgi:hypothetical protein